jgi:putative membrane protein
MLGAMGNVLALIGTVFVFLAAIIHLFIFLMESVLWTRPMIWKRFGLKTQQEADIVKPMAFNQGFYNVFLAVGAGTGLVLLGSPAFTQAGFALALFACASMVVAAGVLVTSSPKLARAAAIQGLAPLAGIVFLLLSLPLG